MTGNSEEVERRPVELESEGAQAELLRHHRQLVEQYEGQGEFEKALHHLKQYCLVQEQVLNEIQQTQATAETANRDRNVFLATLSHELRTPLNAILSYAYILKRDPQVTENQLKGLNIIDQSGNQLLCLLNELDLSEVSLMAETEAAGPGEQMLTVDETDVQGTPANPMLSPPDEELRQAVLLVVDDNPGNLDVLLIHLRQAHYRVLTAESGKTALEYVDYMTPDLILLDVMMPDLDGFETCRRLQAKLKGRNIPIIFMTALSDSVDKVRGFELGAADYVTKPVDMAELLGRIKTHLTLHQLYKSLQAQNRELDAFAHTVAHDLRGPIGNAVAFAQLLRREWYSTTGEQIFNSLNIIEKTGRKALNIIEALLLLASIRQEQVRITPIETGQLIDEVQQRLSYMIAEAKAEIILPAAWPEALGYAPWIEEVWTNYISNAIKYGGQPPRLELGATVQADGSVRFWVQDNGHGLTPAEQRNLFTPFTRLDQVNTDGHGLGLSIVRQIIDKLGGRVGVESWSGGGSRFYFTLTGSRG